MNRVFARGLALPLAIAVGCSGGPTDEASRERAAAPRTPATRTSPAAFPESPTVAARPIHFALDWPSGVAFTVDVSREVFRSAGDDGPRAAGARGEASWSSEVTRDGSTIAVRSHDLSLHVARGDQPEDRLNAVLVAGTFLPSARFSADVDGLELIDGPSSGDLLRRAVEEVTPRSLRALRSYVMIELLFDGTSERLRRQASNTLRPITSLAGRTLAQGVVEEGSDEHASAMGIDVVQATRTRLVGVAPCFEGDAPDACAIVTIDAAFDVSRLAALAPDDAEIRSMQGTTTLLVEPSTLLPHRVVVEKTTDYSITLDDGARALGDTEVLTWLFHYDTSQRS